MINPALLQAVARQRQIQGQQNALRQQAVQMALARQAGMGRVTAGPSRPRGGTGAPVHGGTASTPGRAQQAERRPSGGVTDYQAAFNATNGITQQQQQKRPGGLKNAILGNVIVKGALAGLNVLDYGRRAVEATAGEIGDLATGHGFSGADWMANVRDPNFGAGSLIHTGNKWLDRTIGFAGDVAADPFTYVIPGASEFAGTAGRAALAGEAAAKGLGEEVVARAGQKGVAGLTRAERAALDVSTAYRWGAPTKSFELPFSERLGAASLKAKTGIRGLASDTVLGRTVRSIRNDERLLPFLEKLATGKGEISATDAANMIASQSEHLAAHGGFINTFNKDVTNAAKNFAGRSDLFHAMEQGVRTPETEFLLGLKDSMAQRAKIEGGVRGLKARTNHMPHYNTQDFEEFLGRGEGGGEFMQTRKATPGASGRLEQRVFQPGETIDINGKKITFGDASARDITDKFQEQFPQLQGRKLIEDDPGVVFPRLLENHANDVALKAWETRMKAGGSLLDAADVMEQVPDAAATKEAHEAIRLRVKNDIAARKTERTQLREAIRGKVKGAVKLTQGAAKGELEKQQTRKKVAGFYVGRVDEGEKALGKAAGQEVGRVTQLGAEQRQQLFKLADNLDAADTEVNRLQKVWFQHQDDVSRYAYQNAIDRRKRLVEDMKAGMETEKVGGQIAEPERAFVGAAEGAPTMVSANAAERLRQTGEEYAGEAAQRTEDYYRKLGYARGASDVPESTLQRMASTAENRAVQPRSVAEKVLETFQGKRADDVERQTRLAIADAPTGRPLKGFPYGDNARKAATRTLDPEELVKAGALPEEIMAVMPERLRAAWQEGQQELDDLLRPYRKPEAQEAAGKQAGRTVTEAEAQEAWKQRNVVETDIRRTQTFMDKEATTNGTNTKLYQDLAKAKNQQRKRLAELKDTAPVIETGAEGRKTLPLGSQLKSGKSMIKGVVGGTAPGVEEKAQDLRDIAEFAAKKYRAIAKGTPDSPSLDRAVVEDVLTHRQGETERQLSPLRDALKDVRDQNFRGRNVPKHTPEEVEKKLGTQWRAYKRRHQAQIDNWERYQEEHLSAAEKAAGSAPVRMDEPPVQPTPEDAVRTYRQSALMSEAQMKAEGYSDETIAEMNKRLISNPGRAGQMEWTHPGGRTSWVKSPEELYQKMLVDYEDQALQYRRGQPEFLRRYSAWERERNAALDAARKKAEASGLKVPKRPMSKTEFFDKGRDALTKLTRYVPSGPEQKATEAVDKAMSGQFRDLVGIFMDDVAQARREKNILDADARKAGLQGPKVARGWGKQSIEDMAAPIQQMMQSPEFQDYLDVMMAQRGGLDAQNQLANAEGAFSRAVKKVNDLRASAGFGTGAGGVSAEYDNAVQEAKRLRDVRDQAKAALEGGPPSITDVPREQWPAKFRDMVETAETTIRNNAGPEGVAAFEKQLRGTGGMFQPLEEWQKASQIARQAPTPPSGERAEIRRKLSEQVGIGRDTGYNLSEGDLSLGTAISDLRNNAWRRVNESEREFMYNMQKVTGARWDQPRQAITRIKGGRATKWMIDGKDVEINDIRKAITAASGMRPSELADIQSPDRMLKHWLMSETTQAPPPGLTEEGIWEWHGSMADRAQKVEKMTPKQVMAALEDRLGKGKDKLNLEHVKVTKKLTPAEAQAAYINGMADEAYRYIDQGQAARIQELYESMSPQARANLQDSVAQKARGLERQSMDTEQRLARIDAAGRGRQTTHDPIEMLIGDRSKGVLEPGTLEEAAMRRQLGEGAVGIAQETLGAMAQREVGGATMQEIGNALQYGRELGPVEDRLAGRQAELAASQANPPELTAEGRWSRPATEVAQDQELRAQQALQTAAEAERGGVEQGFQERAGQIAAETDPNIGALGKLEEMLNPPTRQAKPWAKMSAAEKQAALKRRAGATEPGTVNLGDVGGREARATARGDIKATEAAQKRLTKAEEETTQRLLSQANVAAGQARERFGPRQEGMVAAGEQRYGQDIERQQGLQQRFEELGGQATIDRGKAARAEFDSIPKEAMVGEERDKLLSGLNDEIAHGHVAKVQAQAELARHKAAMQVTNVQHRVALQSTADNMEILSGHAEAALAHEYNADELVAQAKANVERFAKEAPKRPGGKAEEATKSYIAWINDVQKWLGSDIPDDAKDLLVSALDDAVTRKGEPGKGLLKLDAKIAGGERFLKDVKDGKVVEIMKDQIKSGYVAYKSKVAGEDLALSADLDRMMNNIGAAFKEPTKVGELLDTYTKFFKAYATGTPAFHIRNSMSATFMNFADGVSFSNQRDGIKIWAAHMRNPSGDWFNSPLIPAAYRGKTAQDVVKAVYGSGAGGAFSAAEIGERAYGRAGGKIKQGLTNNIYVRGSRKTGEAVEGSVRAGMALDSLTRPVGPGRSGSMGGAIQRINRIHFNYNQVSKLDKQARRFIPFWTFLSRNVPLQVQMMWTNPRTYLHYQSFVRNFRDPNSDDSLLPQWMQDRGAFRVSGGIALMPDVGATQLADSVNQLTNPKRLLSQLGPQWKVPAQLLTNQNFFYGNQYGANDFTRVQGDLRVGQPLFNALHLTKNVPGGGQAVEQKYADALRDLVPTLSLLNRVGGLSEATQDKQGQNIASTLLGVPARKITAKDLANEQKRRKGQAKSAKGDQTAERKALAKLASGG